MSALARLASKPAVAEAPERCDLCAAPVPPVHRHMLDLERRRLLCACRACALLFDRDAAGGSHYRLIPQRRIFLKDFVLDDGLWDTLRIPVEMAFFINSSAAGRVVALYPGPMGVTESSLELDDWDDPALRELEVDVEALLVNHAEGETFLVPIDDCYRLAGLIRTSWRGLAGGEDVWREIRGFFATLREEATWATT
jgi:Family of unknown function (DUF5947)